MRSGTVKGDPVPSGGPRRLDITRDRLLGLRWLETKSSDGSVGTAFFADDRAAGERFMVRQAWHVVPQGTVWPGWYPADDLEVKVLCRPL